MGIYLVVEHLSRMLKTLGSIYSKENKQKKIVLLSQCFKQICPPDPLLFLLSLCEVTNLTDLTSETIWYSHPLWKEKVLGASSSCL
jgi:hypothetical protein